MNQVSIIIVIFHITLLFVFLFVRINVYYPLITINFRANSLHGSFVIEDSHANIYYRSRLCYCSTK